MTVLVIFVQDLFSTRACSYVQYRCTSKQLSSASAHFHHALWHSRWHFWHATSTHHFLRHLSEATHSTQFTQIWHAATMRPPRHHLLHHLLHASHIAHFTILHLLHHVHDVAHATHLLEHARVNRILQLVHHLLRVTFHLQEQEYID